MLRSARVTIIGGPDGAAALADDRARPDGLGLAAEHHADAAPLEHVAVAEEAVRARPARGPGQAADQREPGCGGVAALEERADGERVGVDEHGRDAVVGRRLRQPADVQAVADAGDLEPVRA